LSRTNSTYQASPQNFFPFSYGKTIGESAPDDFLYVKENHLGNVLVVVSDRKLPVDINADNIVDYYLADVVSANDYYAFGAPMPGRNFTSTGYRYGFNGKEKDDEVKGNGNSYDYGMRIYDPRLGRFLSVDPLFQTYPWYTPYQFAGNCPVWCYDLDGLEPVPYSNDLGFPERPLPADAQRLTSEIFGMDEEDRKKAQSGQIVRGEYFYYSKTIYYPGLSKQGGYFKTKNMLQAVNETDISKTRPESTPAGTNKPSSLVVTPTLHASQEVPPFGSVLEYSKDIVKDVKTGVANKLKEEKTGYDIKVTAIEISATDTELGKKIAEKTSSQLKELYGVTPTINYTPADAKTTEKEADVAVVLTTEEVRK